MRKCEDVGDFEMRENIVPQYCAEDSMLKKEIDT